MINYKDQLSVYKEIEEIAKTRLADAHLMAGVCLEAEYAQAYQFYINRALECEAIMAFCIQKQAKKHD